MRIECRQTYIIQKKGHFFRMEEHLEIIVYLIILYTLSLLFYLLVDERLCAERL